MPLRDSIDLVLSLPEQERQMWLRSLAPDDAADLIQSARRKDRDALIATLDPWPRAEVSALLAYKEDEAGGLMSPRFARLRPETEMDEAFSYLRRRAGQVETIYEAYVLDAEQRLLGVVSLHHLLSAQRTQQVRNVMRTRFQSVRSDAPHEALEKLIADHRLLAIPVSDNYAVFDVSLEPRVATRFHVAMRFQSGGTPAPMRQTFDTARKLTLEEITHRKAGASVIHGSNGQFNAWIDRSLADLHMMTTTLPTGPYPYARVPWFNAPFGRHGLITAFECLWFWPELARGVLSFLARHEDTDTIADQDAEPGKLVHEMRNGEMASLKEMPFGKYYGAVDGTPLFLLLAGAYYERTGDLLLIRELWPNFVAAMRWMDEYGDRDGDGFVEYRQASRLGLIHQGWKDGNDAIFHEDGSDAVEPIAVWKVQSYVYGAWQAAAKLADALGLHDQADLQRKRADRIRENFERTFWCEEIGSFALAINGNQRPCRVRTSNAGQCLLSGIATGERARQVARTLMSPASFSKCGIRTVAEGEARYNPMAYHNGSVWPHDNGLIAFGLSKYGLTNEVLAIFQGQFEASTYFELHRMPELFYGFRREPGEGPVLYPVACSPQSWAAASVFLLLQSSLGLTIDGVGACISFVRPVLPKFLDNLEIRNLRVGAAVVDLHLTRHGGDASVKVAQRVGQVEILVSH